MMKRNEIVAKLRETAPVLRAEGVARLAIFGSRARVDNRNDSDLDVLIEVDPSAGFQGLRLIGVLADAERTVSAATGIPTHATMRTWLEPRFAERIADDVIEIF